MLHKGEGGDAFSLHSKYHAIDIMAYSNEWLKDKGSSNTQTNTHLPKGTFLAKGTAA